MSINYHITENLDYYLSLNNPEYTFLITGEWGAGKTHFIEHYIHDYNEKNKKHRKIIKISLFGLNSLSSIDEKIFQELHPFLSNKYTRLTGNFLKGALKFGLKIDLNGDQKADGSINTSLEKINFSEVLSSDRKNGEIIIVFDDLERTNIPVKEILGYINYLIEISKVKIILIANEKKLTGIDKSTLTENDQKTYVDFKEKLIGKTFEIKHDFVLILDEFLKNTNSDILKKHKKTIEFAYKKSEKKNLRVIKKTILDFNYLINELEPKHLKENDFIESLVKIFFALSIEIKKGNINESDLRKTNSFTLTLNPSEPIDKIAHLYSFAGHGLYNCDLWADIFFNGDISRLKESTESLTYFTHPKNKEKPIWLKLWNFRDLEHNEFILISKKLVNEFEQLKEYPVNILLHNLSLLIYFSKEKMIDLDVSKIDEKVDEYIFTYKNSDAWNTSFPRVDSVINGTGYAYFDSEDEDFIRQQKKITAVVNDIHKAKSENNEKMHADAIELNLLNYSKDELIEIILNKYQFKPIFHLLCANKFIDTLCFSKNESINMLYQILYERYFSENVKDYPQFWLGVEIENIFWNKLNTLLIDRKCPSDLVKNNTLNALRINLIEKIIEKINQHSN